MDDRRGHGFEFCSSLDFFQALLRLLLMSAKLYSSQDQIVSFRGHKKLEPRPDGLL